jgi:hypothetical protein
MGNLIGNLKKFSFGEMTSNDNGKTSATSTAGLYIIFIGGASFLAGVVDKMFFNNTLDVINQAVMFTTIGATLLGVKNVTRAKKSVTETAPQVCSVCNNTPCTCQPVNS